MKLGKEYVESLRDDVRKYLLSDGEIRRIVGMGESYFALSVVEVDEKVYSELYQLIIDGVLYKFFSKHNS